jgi:hypothetical protein
LSLFRTPGNDEIGPGVSWRLTRVARYRRGNRLASKVRTSALDRDAIDLVAATIDAPLGSQNTKSSVKISLMATRRRAGSFSLNSPHELSNVAEALRITVSRFHA